MKQDALAGLRAGRKLSTPELIRLVIRLSLPAILAQLSSIVMQYIDASMVGHLGSGESASIGLMASSTWLFGGLNAAVSIGFTVQVAQAIGASEEKKARNLVREGLVVGTLTGLLWALLCTALSGTLPGWLGGEEAIRRNASAYFLIFSLALPMAELNHISGGFLQASGNMKTPSLLHVLMCGLDVVFNALLIFPSRTVELAGLRLPVPGAGLGVAGAALGTALAEVVTMLLMLRELLLRSDMLRLRAEEKLHWERADLTRALKLALPVAVQQVVQSGAQVVSTRIVSPLGSVSIAANSFSVTAESFCYMPGYGIGIAASTIIGQSVGARRKDITEKLGWLITGLGMLIMAGSGVLLYVFAPVLIGILSPDPAIRELGTAVLRIEAFAEPLFGASIVANGVLRGAGDTLAPSVMELVSMWGVRLPLAAFLSRSLGLRGVWIAMCTELCVRGLLFLIRLKRGVWLKKAGLGRE